MLGTLAVQWAFGAVHTLGVGGAGMRPADVLVVATGTRPATRGELGIAGDRFAGILPGSAALHLTESGVLLGRRPVVLGGGSLAASCVHALGHAGADQITVVAPDGIVHPGIREADQVLSGWNVAAALGDPRLDAVTLVAGTSRLQITADALILAHRRVAMRNIEQATDPTPGVVFCHSRADPKSLDDARTMASRAVDEALSYLNQDSIHGGA